MRLRQTRARSVRSFTVLSALLLQRAHHSLVARDKKKIGAVAEAHLLELIKQLLRQEGLSMEWLEPIRMLSLITSQNVFPNVKSRKDKMDIREWVKVKKVPGGSMKDCRYVDGLVFTKNVAHKKMKNSIKEPHCLLFRCAIEFQRVENRFSSFDALLQQEQVYLKSLVAKIGAMKPSLVIVEKTVSRLAQEFLLQEGITLLLNVKPKIIDLIHRITAAEMLLTTGW